MPEVLPLVALDVLLVVLWVIAIALLIAVIMGYVAGKLRGLPTPLNQIAGPVASLAEGISSACWKAVKTAEAGVGAAWHAMARYLEKALSQFVAHSAIILHLAQLVGSGLYSVSGLRALVHTLSHVAHAAYSGVKTLEREYHGIEHRVKVIERELAGGIGNDVRTAVRDLEKEYTGLEKRVIPDLRAGIKTAEGEVTQLENFIGAIPGTRYLDWAAGIVAAALGTGFLSFFRCPSFLGNILGRGCGFWNALEDILGLLADAILFADLCEVPTWINEIFGPIEGFLVGLISDAANAACAKPPASYAYPAALPAQLPPPQSIGTLPS